MNFKSAIFLSIISILLFSGCGDSEVKVLKEDYLDTKLGTIEDNKLVKALPKQKPKVEEKPLVVTLDIPKKPLTVQEKKKRFKDILVPISVVVYNELQERYLKVKADIKNNINQEYIKELKKEYKAKSDETLLQALKPHPISILLAQAATESAWLTSRFTKEAYNIFGVWSFNKKEPRIAASGMRGSKTIYLKKYATLKEAVKDYYKNLGRNWAYAEFRKQRTLTDDPYKLSEFLGSYSEKKDEYIKLLKSMIKYNKFDIYDIKGTIN